MAENVINFRIIGIFNQQFLLVKVDFTAKKFSMVKFPSIHQSIDIYNIASFLRKADTHKIFEISSSKRLIAANNHII